MAWKALIVEDEPPAANLLKSLLREHCPQIQLLGEATDIEEAVERIRLLQPDLVFVDIDLHGRMVFEALDQLSDFRGQLIFTTGFNDFALRAFRYNATDYILKPIDKEGLIGAIEKLQIQEEFLRLRYNLLRESVHNEHFEKIVLSTSEDYHVLPVADIFHIIGDGNYATVHHAQGKEIVVSKSLKFFEETLPTDWFFRVHQSHLINFAFVKKILKGEERSILLHNGEIVPLARRKQEEFMQRLQVFVDQA